MNNNLEAKVRALEALRDELNDQIKSKARHILFLKICLGLIIGAIWRWL